MMKKIDGIINKHSRSYYNSENQLLFDPLMYIQRYQVAIACITHETFKKQIKTIVEFGCSEMKFFTYLKNGMPDRDLKIHLVDIDASILKNFMGTVQPLLVDHIKRRKHKLELNVWMGNVAIKNPNFSDVDCVIALELIEHVYPNILEEVPFHIFGIITPKIAIFTTPNCEFNQLFTFGEGQLFRHSDHKFEWTRNQFKDWCHNICQRFPNYIVQIEGVGFPPKEGQLDSIGCCSQLGLFMRKDFLESLDQIKEEEETISDTSHEYDDSEDLTLIPCDDYVLLKSIKYPVFVDNRDRKQKIIDESSYHINRLKYMEDMYYNSSNYRTEIPIQDIARACWEISDDKNEILEAIKGKYKIENDLIIFENDHDYDSEYENYNN